MRVEKKDENSTWDLADILQLESLKSDFPVLRRKEDKKELESFKRGNAELINKEYPRTRKELIKAYLKKLELPGRRDLKEVKHLRDTGDPGQVLNLFENEVKWLEDKKAEVTYWMKPGSLDQRINRARYKDDSLKLDYLLLTKQSRAEVIEWLSRLLFLAEELTRDPFKDRLEAIKSRHKELIDKIDSLDKSTRPGRKKKSDRLKVSTERKYLYRALLEFIRGKYPKHIKEFKKEKDYRLRYNNPETLKTILRGFSKQHENYFSDKQIEEIAIKKPRTLSGLINVCIEVKRNMSERTRKDYLKDWKG
jgi:hypothetical protein